MLLNPQLNISSLSSQTPNSQLIHMRPQLFPIDNLECRICLQSMQKEDLLEVCKCRGSSANVHENCLVEWIKKSGSYKFWMSGCYAVCEICKGNIGLETVTRYRWIRKEEVGSVLFNRHRCCTIMSFMSILCSFLAIVIISFLSSITQVGITSYFFIIAYCVVVGLIVLTFLIYMVKCMIIKDIAQVRISKKNNQKENMNKQKKKEADDGQFVLGRGTTMDSFFPERSKNILIS